MHSVTQPLAATPGLLGSSVHLAASSIPGHPGGDINPVAAAFSYADASPVITAEDVVHHGAHSARKGGVRERWGGACVVVGCSVCVQQAGKQRHGTAWGS